MTDYKSELTVEQIKSLEKFFADFSSDEINLLIKELQSGAMIQNLENRIELARREEFPGRVKQYEGILFKILTIKFLALKQWRELTQSVEKKEMTDGS